MDYKWDKLWINANIATMADNSLGYGLLQNSAVASKNGIISWIGSMQDLSNLKENSAREIFDVGNRFLTPGLIDCHTHVVYAGSRANEFEQRLSGLSYEEIAKSGGGIQSTVLATRKASEEELFAQSSTRIKSMLAEGITTIEIKSGYGLDLESELKILRVSKRIENSFPLKVISTFLGAHSIPKEFANRSDDYVDYVCESMIPIVAKENLASCVDVFCEKIAFNLTQTEKIFLTAKKYNLGIKCHSEQLSNLESASLAARYNALSVDHLEYLSEFGVRELQKSNTVAVLLPGAFYFLRESKKPPIDLLRQYKIPIAIATDCNPGTSPTTSLLLMTNMACILFCLTPEEALKGITINAAKALGIQNSHGSLEIGKIDNIIEWDISHLAELSYSMAQNPCRKIYFSK